MMQDLNAEFKSSLADSIGKKNAESAFRAFQEAASVSIRLNPNKPGAFPAFETDGRIDWNPLGYMLAQRPSFTLDPLFHAGAYYVQDSSAMFVGEVFRKILKRGTGPLRILDLCAAPGGKTTDLAASLRDFCADDFILVANETMRQRASVLAGNVAKWGDPNVLVTSSDPKSFSKLRNYFDVIVADVPCSGEGMFRKDEEALRQWSVDNVALCAARQRRIIADVWDSLSVGGVLVYSTCTFNGQENDGNVKWIAENLGAEILDLGLAYTGVFATACGFCLVPGLVRGEGQYCAALRKTGKEDTSFPSRGRSSATKRVLRNFPEFFGTEMDFVSKDDMILALPASLSSEFENFEFMRPLMKGVAVGTLKGKDLVPHADLALCFGLSEKAFPMVELSRAEALSFLHKDPIILEDAPRGMVIVRYCGRNLGFVKNIGNRCNNLLPQGRRIRMEI